MRKISILAMICHILFVGFLLVFLFFAWLTSEVSHGTVASNFVDSIQDFLRFHPERVIIVLLPIAGYFFQRRYLRLRAEALKKKIKPKELCFSRKTVKRTFLVIMAAFVLYPFMIFMTLLFSVGLNKAAYAYVGAINTAKDHFPPYNLFLFSEDVQEPKVRYHVWVKPSAKKTQQDLVNDIFPIMEDLNIPGSVGRYDFETNKYLPKHKYLIELNGSVDGVKDVVFHYFVKEVRGLDYIVKVKRLEPQPGPLQQLLIKQCKQSGGSETECKKRFKELPWSD